jgi:hypothetical protein
VAFLYVLTLTTLRALLALARPWHVEIDKLVVAVVATGGGGGSGRSYPGRIELDEIGLEIDEIGLGFALVVVVVLVVVLVVVGRAKIDGGRVAGLDGDDKVADYARNEDRDGTRATENRRPVIDPSALSRCSV